MTAKFRQILFLVFKLFVSLVTIFAFYRSFHIGIDSVQVCREQECHDISVVPSSIPNAWEKSKVTVTVNKSLWSSDSVGLFPDDCLRTLGVNGALVFAPTERLCGHLHELLFNLSGLLQPGPNLLELEIENKKGSSGIRIISDARDWGIIFARAMGVLLFTLAWAVFAIRMGVTTGHAALFAFGAALRCYYSFITSPEYRSHDHSGHLQYIGYVIANFGIPNQRDGWEFFQPPGYYALAGLMVRIASALGVGRYDLSYWIQYLSLNLVVVGLLCAVRAFAYWGVSDERPRGAVIASLLLCLWPGMIMHASRISNDVAMVAWCGVFFLMFTKWLTTDSPVVSPRFAIFAGLGFWIKQNSLVMVVTSAVAIALKTKCTWRSRCVASAILGAGVLFIAAPLQYQRSVIENQDGLLPHPGRVGQDMILPNHWSEFVTFNPLAMIEIPLCNIFDPNTRVANMLEVVYRTSLSGEFHYHPSMRGLAAARSFVGIVLIILWLYCARKALSVDRYRTTVLLCGVGFSMLGLTVNRYYFPGPASADFRLIPMLPLYSLPLFDLAAQSNKTLKVIILTISALFSALCLIWFGLIYISWGTTALR